jgi:FkbM family methyltransferase
MQIIYGTLEKNIDVTDICYTKLMNHNTITIPSGDLFRAKQFTDPDVGNVKKVVVVVKDEEEKTKTHTFDTNHIVKIDVSSNYIYTVNDENIYIKLTYIQLRLKIKYGTFKEEYPEQRMVVRYLTGNEKVLEIGGNIGRNSLVIGYLLQEKSNNNFVTMECDSYIASQLNENRKMNKMSFQIENSALSKRQLIQKGWNTIVSDKILPGYNKVNIITLDDLNAKYKIDFDTLVLDCEGAFYYILMDMPEILNNIKLIIMENDYSDIEQKKYVNSILIKNNFYVDYYEPGGWGPCFPFFYEVWKR